MSDLRENKAALKIQFLFRLNKCNKLLEKFNELNLNKIAENMSFNEFKKIIIKKEIIQTTQALTLSLDSYKKGLAINPRVLISSYLIKNYPIELLGDISDRHPFDDYILTLSCRVVDTLNNNNIGDIWNILREFKYQFENWSNMDKNRTIERLIISYYYRSEHIDKIKSEELINEQLQQMITELENQRNDIIKSIILIDKTFDINYLKNNYRLLYKSIQNSWDNIKISVSNNIKKAYYNMLVKDINNGNLISCYNLIKEIGERLCVICPHKQVESFKEKFNDDNLTKVLHSCEFTPEIIQFIGLIVDFILIMDAPANDETNKKWKNEIKQIILSGNFTTDFPKILIQIEEHIDIIYQLIMKLNSE